MAATSFENVNKLLMEAAFNNDYVFLPTTLCNNEGIGRTINQEIKNKNQRK